MRYTSLYKHLQICPEVKFHLVIKRNQEPYGTDREKLFIARQTLYHYYFSTKLLALARHML